MSYLILFSIFAIGYGLWQAYRSAEIAEGNKRFIDSGEEAYFEQRRSWEAYGSTPPIEPGEVARRGRKEIAFGVLGLIAAAVFYLLDQGAN